MTDPVDDVLVRGRGLGRTFRQRGTRPGGEVHE